MRRRFTARLLPSAALLFAAMPALAQAPQAPQGGMPPMDHSRMQGMDHSQMPGMNHSGTAPGSRQRPPAAQQGGTQRPAQPSDRTQAPRN